MKKLIAVLLLALATIASAQTTHTVSAYVETIQDISVSDGVVALFPVENGNITITNISVWSIIPSQGCDSRIDVMDWNHSLSSFYTFFGRNNGPSGSNQDVSFTVPNGDQMGIRAYIAPGQTCTQPAGKVNIVVTYQQ